MNGETLDLFIDLATQISY